MGCGASNASTRSAVGPAEHSPSASGTDALTDVLPLGPGGPFTADSDQASGAMLDHASALLTDPGALLKQSSCETGHSGVRIRPLSSDSVRAAAESAAALDHASDALLKQVSCETGHSGVRIAAGESQAVLRATSDGSVSFVLPSKPPESDDMKPVVPPSLVPVSRMASGRSVGMTSARSTGSASPTRGSARTSALAMNLADSDEEDDESDGGTDTGAVGVDRLRERTVRGCMRKGVLRPLGLLASGSRPPAHPVVRDVLAALAFFCGLRRVIREAQAWIDMFSEAAVDEGEVFTRDVDRPSCDILTTSTGVGQKVDETSYGLRLVAGLAGWNTPKGALWSQEMVTDILHNCGRVFERHARAPPESPESAVALHLVTCRPHHRVVWAAWIDRRRRRDSGWVSLDHISDILEAGFDARLMRGRMIRAPRYALPHNTRGPIAEAFGLTPQQLPAAFERTFEERGLFSFRAQVRLEAVLETQADKARARVTDERLPLHLCRYDNETRRSPDQSPISDSAAWLVPPSMLGWDGESKDLQAAYGLWPASPALEYIRSRGYETWLQGEFTVGGLETGIEERQGRQWECRPLLETAAAPFIASCIRQQNQQRYDAELHHALLSLPTMESRGITRRKSRVGLGSAPARRKSVQAVSTQGPAGDRWDEFGRTREAADQTIGRFLAQAGERPPVCMLVAGAELQTLTWGGREFVLGLSGVSQPLWITDLQAAVVEPVGIWRICRPAAEDPWGATAQALRNLKLGRTSCLLRVPSAFAYRDLEGDYELQQDGGEGVVQRPADDAKSSPRGRRPAGVAAGAASATGPPTPRAPLFSPRASSIRGLTPRGNNLAAVEREWVLLRTREPQHRAEWSDKDKAWLIRRGPPQTGVASAPKTSRLLLGTLLLPPAKRLLAAVQEALSELPPVKRSGPHACFTGGRLGHRAFSRVSAQYAQQRHLSWETFVRGTQVEASLSRPRPGDTRHAVFSVSATASSWRSIAPWSRDERARHIMFLPGVALTVVGRAVEEDSLRLSLAELPEDRRAKTVLMKEVLPAAEGESAAAVVFAAARASDTDGIVELGLGQGGDGRVAPEWLYRITVASGSCPVSVRQDWRPAGGAEAAVVSTAVATGKQVKLDCAAICRLLGADLVLDEDCALEFKTEPASSGATGRHRIGLTVRCLKKRLVVLWTFRVELRRTEGRRGVHAGYEGAKTLGAILSKGLGVHALELQQNRLGPAGAALLLEGLRKNGCVKSIQIGGERPDPASVSSGAAAARVPRGLAGALRLRCAAHRGPITMEDLKRHSGHKWARVAAAALWDLPSLQVLPLSSILTDRHSSRELSAFLSYVGAQCEACGKPYPKVSAELLPETAARCLHQLMLQLLKYGIEPASWKGSDGRTVLHLICGNESFVPSSGHRKQQALRVIEEVCRMSPDMLNARDEQSRTPLHLWMEEQKHHLQPDAVRFLRAAGESQSPRVSPLSVFLLADCWPGDQPLGLLKRMATPRLVNEAGQTGDTALHTAARTGNHAALRMLLQVDGDAMLRNAADETPLLLASEVPVFGDEPGELQNLATHTGSAVLWTASEGRNALHRAAACGLPKICLTLLNALPEKTVRTGDAVGNLPLHLAVASTGFETTTGHRVLDKLLVPATLAARENDDGQTPFQLATKPNARALESILALRKQN